MVPSVTLNRIQSNAGTVRPSPTQLAVIAPCSGGPTNSPAVWTNPNLMQAVCLEGPGLEFATYFMNQAELPVVFVRPTTSTPSSCGSITSTKTGTFSPTVAVNGGYGVSDDYAVLVKFIAGGVLGTAGITYQLSYDNGDSFGPVTALGTALTINPTIPVTNAVAGFTITLGTASETVVAGDSFYFATVGPRMSSGDLITALAALLTLRQPWDCLLVHGEVSAATLADVDSWLASLEGSGGYHVAFMNTRLKNNEFQGTEETEAAYLTAMQTLVASLSPSFRTCLGADGAAVVSSISGITKSMPTSLLVVTRAEQYSTGVDPAEVDLGPLPNANLNDAQSLPTYHDEMIYPGLDQLQLTTLRSFSDPGLTGTFVNNALLFSTNGSDYFYVMNGRTMNAALSALRFKLMRLLGQGIRVDLQTGFILEVQAAKWERICQKAVDNATAGQVSGTLVQICRTDPLTGNGPQTITVTLTNVALKYVKTFAVTAQFANQLPPSNSTQPGPPGG